jgi:hypothetical protein
MNGVELPYLHTSIWVFATVLAIIIMSIVFGYYAYWKRREKFVLKDVSDAAELSAKKQVLAADNDALRQWQQDQKAELERLSAEREKQERLRALLDDLEQQCAKKDQDNQSLRNEVGELENQRHIKSQTLEKLEKEIGNIEGKREEANALNTQINDLKSQLQEAHEALDNIAELQASLTALSAEKATLDLEVEWLRTAAGTAREETEKIRSDLQESKSDLHGARSEKAQLEVQVSTLNIEKQAVLGDLNILNKQVEEFQAFVQNAQEIAEQKKEEAGQATADADEAKREFREAQKAKQNIESEIGNLNAQKAILEREIEKTKGTLKPGVGEGDDPLAPYADLLKKPPVCLSDTMFSEPIPEQDEARALRKLKERLKEAGLLFPSRVVDAFHTCLKCHDINPITVLAGVSGTGKTLLPVAYARLMGMHHLVMAVQPRWDSPQDMFGFFNYLENRYKATELARAMVRMDPYNFEPDQFPMLDSQWTRERILLVLMDEMNLARTEYYFSEFLSRMELRRTIGSPENRDKRSEAEIELDAGPGKYRFRVWVPENILFVGTMNEDETTQALSDKVLDRANVMRFGMPDEKSQPTTGAIQLHDSADYISFAHWQKWHRPVAQDTDTGLQVDKWLSEINLALNSVGRPFGFRLRKAIHQYVANYPNVDEGGHYQLAFADQLEYKIMPRLRGLDMGDNRSPAAHCLDQIGNIIGSLGDRQLIEAFRLAKEESHHLGLFQWRGVTRPVQKDDD